MIVRPWPQVHQEQHHMKPTPIVEIPTRKSRQTPSLWNGATPSVSNTAPAMPKGPDIQLPQEPPALAVPPKPNNHSRIIDVPPTGKDHVPAASSLILSKTSQFLITRWRPSIRFSHFSDPNLIPSTPFTETVQTQSRSVETIPDNCEFVLESEYTVSGLLPRSCNALLVESKYPCAVVFDLVMGVSPYGSVIEQVDALSKLICIEIFERKQQRLWKCLLRVVNGRNGMMAYLMREEDMAKLMVERVQHLLGNKRLPLVIDAKSFIRTVEKRPFDPRSIPEDQALKAPGRIYELNYKLQEAKGGYLRVDEKDGNMRILTADGLVSFLGWASEFFEISLCGTDDKRFLNAVAKALDPEGAKLRGPRISVSQECGFFLRHMKKGPIKPGEPLPPPKDLMGIYPFTAITDPCFPGNSFTLPVILDDSAWNWPENQRYNLINVVNQARSPLWNIGLAPIQQILKMLHQSFFNKLDKYYADLREGKPFIPLRPPSAVFSYFELMRNSITGYIGRGEINGGLTWDSRAGPGKLLPPPTAILAQEEEEEKRKEEQTKRGSGLQKVNNGHRELLEDLRMQQLPPGLDLGGPVGGTHLPLGIRPPTGRGQWDPPFMPFAGNSFMDPGPPYGWDPRGPLPPIPGVVGPPKQLGPRQGMDGLGIGMGIPGIDGPPPRSRSEGQRLRAKGFGKRGAGADGGHGQPTQAQSRKQQLSRRPPPEKRKPPNTDGTGKRLRVDYSTLTTPSDAMSDGELPEEGSTI